MKRLLLFIIFFLHSLAGNGFGYETMVIKSSGNKVNEQLQQSFSYELNRRLPRSGLKSMQPHQIQELILGPADKIGSAQKTQKAHPDLILALGSKALKVALLTSDIPIVYLLIIEPEKMVGNRSRVSGVSLTVPIKTQLAELSRSLPQVKRIGVVYDPTHSGKLIDEAQAARPDLTFIRLAADHSSGVPDLLASLQGRIDLLWMIPDVTTTNRKTVQSYLLFSVKNKIPLLTFSEKFIRHGATIAITFDSEVMGRQAADLAVDLLAGRPGKSIPPRVKTVVNDKMARKLRIAIAPQGQAND